MLMNALPFRTPMLAAVLLFTSLMALAEGESERFKMANEAFAKKEYEKAAKLYEALAQAGIRSAELEYNLGNTHFRLGNRGKAILHYERALVLSPGMAEAALNLEFVRAGIEGEAEPLPDFILTRWWRAASSCLPANLMGGMAVLLWAGGCALLGALLLGRFAERKKKLMAVGMALLLVGALAGALAASRAAAARHTGRAVVLTKQTSLRAAPDAAAAEVQPVAEGYMLILGEKLGEWQHVTLMNGDAGWLRIEDFEGI